MTISMLVPMVAIVLAVSENSAERKLQIMQCDPNKPSCELKAIDTVYAKTVCGFVGDTINVLYHRFGDSVTVLPSCAESEKVGIYRNEDELNK